MRPAASSASRRTRPSHLRFSRRFPRRHAWAAGHCRLALGSRERRPTGGAGRDRRRERPAMTEQILLTPGP